MPFIFLPSLVGYTMYKRSLVFSRPHYIKSAPMGLIQSETQFCVGVLIFALM